MLNFDHPYEPDPGVLLAPGHLWTVDTRPAPGITGLLDHSAVKPAFGAGEEVLSKGSLIHLGCHWSTFPDFDYETFKIQHPEIIGYVESGRRALEYFNVRQGWTEINVCHRRLWYATAIDAIGSRGDEALVLNWKSGEPCAWHSIQSAGEHMAFTQDDFANLENPVLRASVYLASDGTFDPTRQVHIHDDKRDFAVFEAACTVTEWKQRNGYARPKGVARRAKEDVQTVPLESSTLFESVTPQPQSGGLF